MTNNPNWLSEISDLRLTPRPELSARWEAIYACPPPKGARRILLERAIAWHIQAKMFGGHSAKDRKQLSAASRRPDVWMDDGVQHPTDPGLAGGKPSDNQTGGVSRPRLSRSAPKTGARLIREWNGVAHVVEVAADGFVWQGRSWKSLSAIAQAITGAHWSGPRFFGL